MSLVSTSVAPTGWEGPDPELPLEDALEELERAIHSALAAQQKYGQSSLRYQLAERRALAALDMANRANAAREQLVRFRTDAEEVVCG